MSTADTAETTATQVYRVYIKASPEAIWEAITDPEWTNRYGYTGYTHYDLRPGGAMTVVPNDEFKAAAEAQGFPCPDPLVDGEVIEADPPTRLVTTWRFHMDPDALAEGYTRLVYEIARIDDSTSRLTVTHELEGAPVVASIVSGAFEDSGSGGGGWAWVLSDLKTLLETGAPMASGA